MQLPIIKDGVVVNVVEFEPGTTCFRSKAALNDAKRAEDLLHDRALEDWRRVVSAMQDEERAAAEALASVRRAQSDALQRIEKARAAPGANADALLNAISTIAKEVAEHELALEAVSNRPLPVRPSLTRPRRWVVPDGCTVGAAGGSIGERWDGERYVRDEPKEEAAQPDKV